MSQALILAGWVLAVGGLAAAALARYRMASFAEAVARACHELRGPLTAARLGLELSFRVGESAVAPLRAIELELARATLALEDLCELWQTTPTERRAAEAMGEGAVDVAGLLGDLVEAWRRPARERGVGLRLVGSGPRPLVVGERLRLAQAVANLIANAVEHGGGPVEVSWHADVATVRIEVADQGVGLPAPIAELARRRPRRWPTLRPARMRRGRHRAGSRRGHGLAIASAIAASHRGRLASAPSQRGARLVLELPAARGLGSARTSAPRLGGGLVG